LSAIGDQIEVKDENLIDMATAVSGSGPAVRRHYQICHILYTEFDLDELSPLEIAASNRTASEIL
jgi:hypothetical protein